MSRVPYTVEQLKRLGLVEHNGSYVPVKSLVDKKPIKFKPIDEGSFIGGIDPYRGDNLSEPASVFIKDGEVVKYIGRPEIKFPELLKELQDTAKFYGNRMMSELTTVKIKPLTQNRAWKGRRFKSEQYKVYASAVSLLLPNDLVVPEGLLRVYYEFGMSTNSDFDNPCKMFTDILQARYHFNDRNIMEATIKKVVVKKGDEYIKFKIESL